MKRRDSYILMAAGAMCALSVALWIAAPAPDAGTGLGVGESYASPTALTLDMETDTPSADFKRYGGGRDFSGITFTPWDTEAASANLPEQPERDYTIMVYMNGSDLESENAAATIDILEMLGSGLDTDSVNLIIFTGGTNRWRNNLISENECALWRISGGRVEKIAGIGLIGMGDPGTLSGFIEFGMDNYPAQRYGLILWDHGGGSIAGYGHDEKFADANLTLLDMDYAFSEAGLTENPLAFLGFDSCLMAAVEMADVAAPYAEYLIASEDLEPGDGWDYAFLAELNANPDADGLAVGMAVADYFMDFYGARSSESLTMSVTDLNGAGAVMDAMGALMSRCSEDMAAGGGAAVFASRRHGTKTFGEGSPRDNQCDMVDIGDMALWLSDLFPEEAAAVLAALEGAVAYNRHNSAADLGGLSAYYIYGGKAMADVTLSAYASLNVSDGYTSYLHDFARALEVGATGSARRRSAGISSGGLDDEESENTPPVAEDIVESVLTLWKPLEGSPGYYIMAGLDCGRGVETVAWPAIEGQSVCMYAIGGGEQVLYAIPAQRNGDDCDIIISLGGQYPDGGVLGARREEGFIIQKGYDEIEDGDTIALYYPRRFGDKTPDGWELSDTFTVDGGLELEWNVAEAGDMYALRLRDVWSGEYFTALAEEPDLAGGL